jgi:integrase
MASLFYRKTGTETYTIYVQYRTPDMLPGRYKQKSTGIKMKRVRKRNGCVIYPQEAHLIRDKIERSIALRKFHIIQKKQSVVLSGLVDKFIHGRGRARSNATQYHYKHALRKFSELIGDVDVSLITEATMLDFRELSIQEYGDQNTSIWIRALSPIFNWAVSQGYMEQNPVTKSVRFKPAPVRKKKFSNEESERLFQYLRKSNPDLYYLCSFLLRTGLRVMDALELKWSDIDFEAGVIYFEDHKSRRADEEFPITPGLHTLLKSMPREYEPRVFRWKTTSTVNRVYSRIRRKLKLHEDLTMHALKRTYATMLSEAGVPVSAARILAHHKDYKTTLTYYTDHEREYLRKQASLIDPEIEKVTGAGIIHKK